MNITFTLLCSYFITFHRPAWDNHVFISISAYHCT
nr:MAG TPA: hypothetical protein [Caudoviricetes sp.]